MKLHLNFYGHTVDIDPTSVVDALEEELMEGAEFVFTEDKIAEKISDLIWMDLAEDSPVYTAHGKEELVKAVLKEIQDRKEFEEGEENED